MLPSTGETIFSLELHRKSIIMGNTTSAGIAITQGSARVITCAVGVFSSQSVINPKNVSEPSTSYTLQSLTPH